MDESALNELADELREFLIAVAENREVIAVDLYGHGRTDALPTIRQHGGLSGFLRRGESEFDTFGAGHAGTSISAALGMAAAAHLDSVERQVVAIIGDGALTAGEPMEALNNAGAMDTD